MPPGDRYALAPASPEELRSSALACVAGAFIGDSCGGILEFCGNLEELLDFAMKMKGGGSFGLKPGQITDDGEMAMSLADGIVRSLNSRRLTAIQFGHSIVMSYKRWFSSIPFDYGETTVNGICYDVDEGDARQVDNLYEHTKSVNIESLSNGCIMKLSPLAVWLSQFYSMVYPKNQDLAIRGVICVTMLDTSITHSNPAAIMISSMYCVLLTHLIAFKKNKYTIEGAISACLSVLDKFPDRFEEDKKHLKKWVKEAYKTNRYESAPNKGFVKYGFSDAITVLKNESNFREALRRILKAGGDTDTNAAIALAAFGAYVGLDGIDKYYIKGLDEAEKYIRNDVDFTSSKYKNIVDTLLKTGATEEDVIGIMKTMGEIKSLSDYSEVWEHVSNK